MFEKFSAVNLDTFRQRYEGTFGFYKDESGKRKLVKITSVSAQQCDFEDQGGVTFSMYPDSPRDIGFEFLPPKSNWYNTGKGAVYCQRLALRHYQRGVTGKSMEIYVLARGEMHPVRLSFSILSDIYEKAKAPKEALPTFGELSLAISGQFALDHGRVLLYKEDIGTYTFDKKAEFTFKLNEPDLWRTEITDAVVAMGCTAKIN